MITSAAEIFSDLCISTGIPLPSSSTVIELTVQPSSNDVIPVRDQIVEIDVANSLINVEEDTFVGGSAEAGVGYSTSSSY